MTPEQNERNSLITAACRSMYLT